MVALNIGNVFPNGTLVKVVSTSYRKEQGLLLWRLCCRAPVCYGDLRSHERVPLLFSVFI
ncbi:hypothetical protein MKW92_039657 [Papaver armeniacum]|nr:hypothetical protein MKW92_039657 [Papaver armeniacum]